MSAFLYPDMPGTGEHLSTPLSPFENLPLDVIEEICVACLDTTAPSAMSPREVPLLLTSISPHLRHVALNTPKLWTSISVFDANAPFRRRLQVPKRAHDPLDIARAQLRIEVVKMWLRLSGNMPLSIHYVGPSGYPVKIDVLLEQAMTDVFLSCCSRWQDIDFELRNCSAVCVAKLTAPDVPLLRSLRLRSTDSNGSFLLSSTLLQAPALNILSLAGVGRHIIKYPAIWANITHLVLHGVDAGRESTAGLARLSTMATRLVSLDISLQNHSQVWLHQLQHDHVIVLPCVQVLSITEPHRLGIVRTIHAPALRTLILRNIPHPPELTALLSCSPVLRKLDLCCDDFGALVKPLRACTALTSLRAVPLEMPYPRASGSYDNVLDAFVYDDERDRVCPRLEVLDCEAFTLDVSFTALYRFITRKQGRVPGLSRWKKLCMHVRFEQDEHQAIKALISEQRQAGSVLSITRDAREGFYLLQTSANNAISLELP
ncbi:hypothetical protein HYPSUDRAFT_220216 [Hypholoma sublateritium FD-334 SS-4]|uniref:F-box domain-containing protein n=1 Tax=Hypholoma sublateritium (strain FD-334 SS-4) TaxID=945553 RepID=A0A0D2NEB4_HYPSF|nr:hypothetical protein HYPSUDRAFT_220216 [Hypholoma sublateritium FD-334 SS-4]